MKGAPARSLMCPWPQARNLNHWLVSRGTGVGTEITTGYQNTPRGSVTNLSFTNLSLSALLLWGVGVRCPQNRVLQTLSQKDYARRKNPLCADYARTTRGGETNNKCNSGKTIHHTEPDLLLWFAIQIVTVAVDSYRCPIYFIYVSLSLSLFLYLSLYIYIHVLCFP